MKILVLGVSGMLGSSIFRVFCGRKNNVYGTLRNENYLRYFNEKYVNKLVSNCDVNEFDKLQDTIFSIKPDVIINCVGLIKQISQTHDPVDMVNINALLPHRLKVVATSTGARLIHISTDCVFSGKKGGYLEDDCSDASDIYGKSKYLGELDGLNCITLRTSLIGHELQSKNSLVEWFLNQQGECDGYTKAIFSGLPASILAKIIADIIIPDESLNGVFHVAAQPISKFDLLHLIAKIYNKKIKIKPCDMPEINRSLCANKFNKLTGYEAPCWEDMIETMYRDKYK